MKVLHMCTIYNISIIIHIFKSTGILDLYAYKIICLLIQIYLLYWCPPSLNTIISFLDFCFYFWADFPDYILVPFSWYSMWSWCLSMHESSMVFHFIYRKYSLPSSSISHHSKHFNPVSLQPHYSDFSIWTHLTLRSIKQ